MIEMVAITSIFQKHLLSTDSENRTRPKMPRNTNKFSIACYFQSKLEQTKVSGPMAHSSLVATNAASVLPVGQRERSSPSPTRAGSSVTQASIEVINLCANLVILKKMCKFSYTQVLLSYQRPAELRAHGRDHVAAIRIQGVLRVASCCLMTTEPPQSAQVKATQRCNCRVPVQGPFLEQVMCKVFLALLSLSQSGLENKLREMGRRIFSENLALI